uniref:Uncharacterized protein n=1 Tax=Zea mays TaxID=4577 RepID=A0A804RD62_MAIZE
MPIWKKKHQPCAPLARPISLYTAPATPSPSPGRHCTPRPPNQPDRSRRATAPPATNPNPTPTKPLVVTRGRVLGGGHGQGRGAGIVRRRPPRPPGGHRRERRRHRHGVVVVRELARVRARAGADPAARGAAGAGGDGAGGGDEPRAGAVGRGHGARAAVVGPGGAGARRHGGRGRVRDHGARRQALRGARRRRVLRHCGPLRAALRLLLHRVRRRHARRRRRLQLPPRHVRGAGGVPDGGEPDHGVRVLQRRRGAQLHGVPGHGGGRGRAPRVADRRARPARGLQPGGPRRRRRHPPRLRLHLLQHQGELGGEPGADGGARGVHPVRDRDGVPARRRAQPDAAGGPGAQPRRVLPARRRGRVQRRGHGVPQLHRVRRRVHHGGGGAAAGARHPRRRVRLRRRRHRALLPHGRLHVHAPPLRRD